MAMNDMSETDATTRRVYTAYRKFAQQGVGWTTVSEYAYLKIRESGSKKSTGVEE